MTRHHGRRSSVSRILTALLGWKKSVRLRDAFGGLGGFRVSLTGTIRRIRVREEKRAPSLRVPEDTCAIGSDPFDGLDSYDRPQRETSESRSGSPDVLSFPQISGRKADRVFSTRAGEKFHSAKFRPRSREEAISERKTIERGIQDDSCGNPPGRRVLGDYFSVLLPALSSLGPASATREIPVRLEESALSRRVACHRQRLSAQLYARR